MFEQERGIQLDGNLELDEETRFSSVRRADDSGYDETEDILLDSRNDETFGDAPSSVTVKPLVVMNSGKTSDGTQGSSRFSSMVISYLTWNSFSSPAYQLVRNYSINSDIRFWWFLFPINIFIAAF